MVQSLAQQGFDVYLTDWIPPASSDSSRGLDAYVNEDLVNAAHVIAAERGANQVSIIGYCLGALLGVIYTALRCRRLCGAAREVRIGPRPKFNSPGKSASRLRVHSPKAMVHRLQIHLGRLSPFGTAQGTVTIDIGEEGVVDLNPGNRMAMMSASVRCESSISLGSR